MNKATKSQTLRGIAASPGLAYGPAFLWQEAEMVIPRHSVTDAGAELGKLAAALSAARQEIEQIIRDTAAALGKKTKRPFSRRTCCSSTMPPCSNGWRRRSSRASM